MGKDLFKEVVEPSAKVRSKNDYVVALSIILHAIVISTLIIISPTTIKVSPKSESVVRLKYAPPHIVVESNNPPSPFAKPAPISKPKVSNPTAKLNPKVVPLEPPKGIPPEPPIVYSPPGASGNKPGDSPNISGYQNESGLPSSPKSSPLKPQEVFRLSKLEQPKKIKDVKPVYPAIAQEAHIQGVVIIEAVIGTDGKVQNLKILHSIPLLDFAALEAVKQWVYTPPKLNGQPVTVIMTVTVNFALQ